VSKDFDKLVVANPQVIQRSHGGLLDEVLKNGLPTILSTSKGRVVPFSSYGVN